MDVIILNVNTVIKIGVGYEKIFISTEEHYGNINSKRIIKWCIIIIMMN